MRVLLCRIYVGTTSKQFKIFLNATVALNLAVNVISPTFLNDILVLEPLVFTGVVSLFSFHATV